MVELTFQPINLGQQAIEAKEAGEAEVSRLLQAPEDLARLPALRAELAGKVSGIQASLSSSLAGQVEAARYGLQLLDKSHRHIAKLRLCIDKIDKLCGECTTLVENHDKIRCLSLAHRHVVQVLEELEDIIDLPARAAAVEDLLAEGDGALVPAFEGLTVLEGTANNVKKAWSRNLKKQQDIGELMQYLEQVHVTVQAFERRLWRHVRNYHALAMQQPGLLVDCARIVELQEQMDAHYARTKASWVRAKHFKERALLEMEASVRQRWAPMLVLAGQHGEHNTRAKYDQDGNLVISEKRDYLGALVDVDRVDASGRKLPGATDAELALMQIHEKDIFSEDLWLNTILEGMSVLQGELVEVYDYVAPCWPPHFNIFDAIMQMYHVQAAQVMDAVGQVGDQLTTPSQLALMQWVSTYQETLRGLGVQEELVHLPLAPLTDGSSPGLVLLMESYTCRAETFMNSWFRSMLEQDIRGQPQQRADGTLRTLGAIEFFKMLNEQVSILEEISRGEVLFQAASRSLKVMRDFVAAQQEIITRGAPGAAATAAAGGAGAGAVGVESVGLSLELTCALLNNNLDCYKESLAFVEHVQEQLEPAYAAKLDVEDTCRAFLELAKLCGNSVVAMIFADEGMVEQFKRLYIHPEWLRGTTTQTILVTIADYLGDIQTFVDPSFRRRIVEAVMDELVKKHTLALMASTPSVSQPVLTRMDQDEKDVEAFFEQHLPMDKVVRKTAVLSDLMNIMTANTVEGLLLGYGTLLDIAPIPPSAIDKLAANRPDLSKVQLQELSSACKDLYSRQGKAPAAPEQQASKGWKFWK